MTLGNPDESPGAVIFLDNGATSLGAGTVVGSAASLTTTLTPGFHHITAVYTGNAATLDATSAVLIQWVNRNATTAVKLAIIRTRRAGRKFVERLRITNPGSQASGGGPLLLAIDNLSANAALVYAAGTTKTLLLLGSHYVVQVTGTGNAPKRRKGDARCGPDVPREARQAEIHAPPPLGRRCTLVPSEPSETLSSTTSASGP